MVHHGHTVVYHGITMVDYGSMVVYHTIPRQHGEQYHATEQYTMMKINFTMQFL